MIAIIDYDAGNMKSVEKAFQYLNEDAVITRDRKAILEADRVVLPGVGAFGDAMERLHLSAEPKKLLLSNMNHTEIGQDIILAPQESAVVLL